MKTGYCNIVLTVLTKIPRRATINKKIRFSKVFLLLLLFEGTFTVVFKEKKVKKEVTK
jgi:hypothetical protein